ncbi:MAG TPA: hypothetical protein VJ828_06930 [Lacipirellulaceae bacterium]|nr:hypothetical protein [Lacipirellulaceae bacterium]
MIRFACLTPAILLVVSAPPQCEFAYGDELPAAARLLDDNIVMYLRPVPLTSPSGKYVAYVSRGFVCLADVELGTTRKLVEVPGTWTHVFAGIDETRSGGGPDSIMRALGSFDKYKELQAKVTGEIGDFQWTVDSSAIVFGVHSYDVAQQATRTHVWRVPLDGEPKVIASDERSLTTRRGPGGKITRDGRFLVRHSGRERALIWDIAKNAPRATPFLYLAPSPTSERWLGVEKDTRQLVVLDGEFNVIARHEEILPENEFGFDMKWSPDERFVFWRQQIGFDYYSNWTGCLYDLETRRRQIFTGDYMDENIEFTGNRGEFLRVGASGVQRAWSGLDMTEQYVGIVPDGRVHMQRFWDVRADSSGTSSKDRLFSCVSNVTWSPDFHLFTIGLPRQEGRYGEVMHLADRERHLWKLPGNDSGQYISPYNVAGFALNGKLIIAYDDARLFALPVATIQTSQNDIRQ